MTAPRLCARCQGPISRRPVTALYCCLSCRDSVRAADLREKRRCEKQLRAQAALDAAIIAHWRAGLDTAAIAERTDHSQAEIANRLAHLRDRDRQSRHAQAS